MNVFILCTGRCGSTTFIKACQHIINYSAAHESRIHEIGAKRLAYPQNHIEADNRLSWFLGRLEKKYGNRAVYVHLRRDIEATARSFAKRWSFGIMRAYRDGILLGGPDDPDILEMCRDYCHSVTSNIEAFLKDKSNKLVVDLETAQEDFAGFWDMIAAEGDLEAACREWSVAYNKSRE